MKAEHILLIAALLCMFLHMNMVYARLVMPNSANTIFTQLILAHWFRRRSKIVKEAEAK
jgi:hypothetical protein